MALESAQSQIDVINVAGLLIGPEQAALERSLMKMYRPRSLVTVAPTPPPSPLWKLWEANEDPETCIQRAVAQIEEQMTQIANQQDSPNIVLLGRSYGAFMALQAALRLKLENFLKIVLIEGPLHPEVDVDPAMLLPCLQFCRSHYAQRPALSQNAMDALAEQGTDRILIIGNSSDGVVPPAAMGLPRGFQPVDMESDDLGFMQRLDTRQGAHVVIPPGFGGVRRSGWKGVFPRGYQDHLFWSPEKLALITRLIGASLPSELMVEQEQSEAA